MAKTNSNKLSESVKTAEASVDDSQIESSAKAASDALNKSIETVIGAFAGEVEGGVESITAKFDRFKDRLNNTTTEGLLADTSQAIENLALDYVEKEVSNFLSKFGANVDITFSEPDSNGVVVPIETSLDAEGGISGSVASVLTLITGLGVNTGSLQRAVIEGNPEGVLRAGEDILTGKMGAFDGAEAINSLTGAAVTSVTDVLVTNVNSALASNSNLNTVINGISAIDSDGSGGISLTRTAVTASRILSGNTDSAEFNTAITKSKTDALADLNRIVTNKDNIKTNLEKAQDDIENLSGGKDPNDVLSSVSNLSNTKTSYTGKSDEYRSLVKTRVAKNSQTGIVQGISIEILTDIKKQVRSFAPKLTEDEVNSVVALSQGDVRDVSSASRILFDATGKPFDEIRAFVISIDTTIESATKPRPTEQVFSEPYVIGSFEKTWENGQGDPKFPYISSLEELQAEIRNVDREITEVVVHWTESHTDKNIGSEEINKYHLELDLNGIGYHYVIRRDGSLQRGRPVNIEGQHAPTNNHDLRSIAVVFVGGINVPSGTPNSENFLSAQSLTRSQINTFDHFCRAFYAVFPGGQIIGHNEIDEDEIDPGFEVTNYVENVFGKKSKFTDSRYQEPLTVEEILSNDE